MPEDKTWADYADFVLQDWTGGKNAQPGYIVHMSKQTDVNEEEFFNYAGDQIDRLLVESKLMAITPVYYAHLGHGIGMLGQQYCVYRISVFTASLN